MTQEQFNIIVKIIQGGAPALASELIEVIQETVVACQSQAKEIAHLKEELTKATPTKATKKGED